MANMRRSFPIVPARPRTRRLRTWQSERRRVKSRPDRPAARIGSANTTSCFASKKNWEAARDLPAGAPFERSMHKLVLLRHGESIWNRENRFTGWKDVDLSERGLVEAAEAGRLLREEGYAFDLAYTSLLKRAIRTLWIALDVLDRMWIPVVKDWRLNERHYGALEGLNKAETTAKHGEAQVKIWRRSYDIPPPSLSAGDPRHPLHDPRYAGLSPQQLPPPESLTDPAERVIPYWQGTIAPAIAS